MLDKNLIARAERNIREAQQEPDLRGDVHAAKLVNDLFKSLFACYPAWKQAFPAKTGDELDKAVNTLKKNWIKAFAENQINTVQQVSLGMKRARQDTSDFLPGVGKFMGWCKPSAEDLGLPSIQEAYSEATRKCREPSKKKFNHPAVYHAGKLTGWFLLAHKSERDTYPKFKECYEGLMARVLDGEVLSIPEHKENLLEKHENGKKVNTEQNKKAGNAALDELRRGL